MVSMAVGQMGYSWSSVCSAAECCARYFFAKGDIHHSPGQRPGLKNHLRPVWPTAIVIVALGNAPGHWVRSVAFWPTAIVIVALGNAPGRWVRSVAFLANGHSQASSVPDVLFIEFDAITIQNGEVPGT